MNGPAYPVALLFGVVAGLRALTAPVVVATAPMQFAGRLITGTLSGAAIGASANHALGGALAGLVGAVIGTLGGSRARARLAGAFHNDHPAALIEDAVAIGGALLIGIAGL